MAGMRKKMWTFYLFLQKQNNKRGLIQNNKTIYTEVNDANKIFRLLFQGVIAFSKPFILCRMRNNYIVHGENF